ncbi:MAG: hypothetical protein F4018_00310 [Acidobacteria bacterium]|nr:hypothetical protein [Acidobacteriota bacterium]
MKPTRRELSIFSVSAIDLFASALGAFVVVAFVLLPHFPNTGDAPAAPVPPADPPAPAGLSPAELETLRGQATRTEAELDAARRREQKLAQALDDARTRTAPPPAPDPQDPISPAELAALRSRIEQAETELDAAQARERELARALDAATSSVQSLPPIDLIIALDTTSSMTGEVASLREEIAGLSELLVDLTEDAAVGIIDFKDGCGRQPALRVAPLQRIDRQSVRRLAAFARSMRPGSAACNVTADEDYAEALRAAVNADWRDDSEHRSIVMISDNPAHADLRRQAVADAGRFARRPGARHTVSAVFVDTSMTAGPGYPDAAACMQRVAWAGGGRFVRADENASLSVTILRAIFDG